MSVLLFEMMRVKLLDVITFKVDTQTYIVNDVGDTVNIVFHLFFIEDYF